MSQLPLIGELLKTKPKAIDCELPIMSVGRQTNLMLTLIGYGYPAPKMRRTENCTVIVYAERG